MCRSNIHTNYHIWYCINIIICFFVDFWNFLPNSVSNWYLTSDVPANFHWSLLPWTTCIIKTLQSRHTVTVYTYTSLLQSASVQDQSAIVSLSIWKIRVSTEQNAQEKSTLKEGTSPNRLWTMRLKQIKELLFQRNMGGYRVLHDNLRLMTGSPYVETAKMN